MAQMVKKFPAMQEIQLRFLGQEDTLEKGTAPHSSILAWRISWTKKPGRLQSMYYTQSDTTEQLTHTHTHTHTYTQMLMRYFTHFYISHLQNSIYNLDLQIITFELVVFQMLNCHPYLTVQV